MKVMNQNAPFHLSIKDDFESEKRERGFHFILYIDLLGTSGKSLIELEETIHFLYSRFKSTIEYLKRIYDKSYRFSQIKKVLIFQDSVFVVFDNSKMDNLNEILIYVRTIFAMCFVHQIPVRGGIAHGEVIMYENTIFGKPVECLIKNEKFDMLGIKIDQSIKNFHFSTQKEPIRFHKLTSDQGDDFLDWLIGLCIYFPAGKIEFASFSDYFEALMTKFKIPENENAKMKYENTKQFFYFALNYSPKLNQVFLNNQSRFTTQNL